ncbi:hypothetical protein PLICRDRAFT_97522 [Plicaturopsis crispa FD-325 SS-3]|nr:hypothetical protein PLICRDRAFT_97522 [Plicaturopsis crispa FD-325 SS-3]
MSYENPLHPPVPVNKFSPFTSINASLLTPTRQRVPQPQYAPASKWKATICRAPEQRPVTFDIAGYPAGYGVPLRELCTRGPVGMASMIAGASEPVLAHYGLKKIKLRILWPGYPHVDFERTIDIYTPSGPITRVQLASAIAMNYARWVDKTQYEAINPQYAQWRVGGGALGVDRLILISLWNVFDDSWQAEIALDVPARR